MSQKRKPLAKTEVDPNSLRGKLAVKICGILAGARLNPDLIRTAAKEQELTEDQMLGVMITEAVLKMLPGQG